MMQQYPSPAGLPYGAPYSSGIEGAGYPGYGPNAWLAMPDLRVRPVYRSEGWADPALFRWAAMGAVLMAALAGVCVLINHVMPPRFPMVLVQTLGAFVLFTLASLFTIRVIDRGRAQSLWIVVLVNVCLTVVFLAVYSLGGYSVLGPYLPPGSGGAGPRGLSFLGDVILLTWMGTQISLSDALRVFYRTPKGWTVAEERRAYFRSGSGEAVLAALEQGDAGTLAALRGDPPSAGHGWQRFTVMTLSTCSGDPIQPAYLHLKNVRFGGGPVLANRHYTTSGRAFLRHVQLVPGDLERLQWLVPELFAPRRVIAGEPGSPVQGTPLGLPAGAPPVVESPTGSFVRRVEPGEERNFRFQGGLGLYVMFGSLLLTFGSLAPIALLNEKDKIQQVIIGAYALLVFVALVAGLVLGITYGRVGRIRLRKRVAVRPYRLFNPDDHTILLAVEESRTFHRMKLLPDDFALLQAVPGMLLLEAGRTRVRLMAQDVDLGFHQSNAETSLRISARLGEYEWAVTVRDPGKSGSLSGLGNSRKRAEDLWRRIYERLVAPAPGAW